MNTLMGGGGDAGPGRVRVAWIGEAWQWFLQAPGVWVGVAALAVFGPVLVLVIAGVGLGVSAALTANVPGSFTPSAGPLGPAALTGGMLWFFGVILLAALFYMPFVYSGLFGAAVRQLRGEPLSIGSLFGGGPSMWRMLGALLLIGLSSYLLNLILLAPFLVTHVVPLEDLYTTPANVPPGVLAVRYAVSLLVSLVVYSLTLPVFPMVADGVGVFAAFSESVRVMSRQWLSALGVVFVFGLFFLAGLVPCLLGMLVTVPLFVILSALAYRDLIGLRAGAVPPSYGMPPAGVWPPPPGPPA